MARPYVLLSAAVSVDGYLSDNGTERLPFSSAEDWDQVDQARAESDAILIGAATVRRDNPRLLVYSDERRAARVARGLPEYPLKVTVTGSGLLDPGLRFWHTGGRKLVYTTTSGAAALPRELSESADVVALGPEIAMGALLDDLGARGVTRLMVEGGGHLHTAFLAAGLADEIRLAVAPMLIGQVDAPRFLHPAEFPGGPARRFGLADVAKLGDVAVLRFTLGPGPGSPAP
ncbi:RibD family protein [Actinokineospora sp. HUAS TT18]|uniref:RibD family protein n=1 Tax=Actinokineospora sp. HUAS TT18 TaxID=3447451 RepID=UPI003F51FF6C